MASRRQTLSWSLVLLAVVALVLWSQRARSARPGMTAPAVVPVLRESPPAAPAVGALAGARDPAGEAAIAPAEVEGGVLEVLVIDAEQRRLLEGARLHAYGPGEEELLGTSDSAGRIAADRSRATGRDLLCSLEGYASERVAAPGSELPERLVVELAREVLLEGRIVVPRGDTLPHGLIVIAWPDSEPVPTSRTRSELLQLPGCLVAESGPQGEFRFRAQPDTFYSGAAGGHGWAGGTHSLGRPGDGPREILVHRLYGRELRLRSGGAPLELSPAFGGWHYGTPELPRERGRASGMSWTSPGVALNLALERSIEDARVDSWTRIPLFVEPYSDSVPLAAAIPGVWMQLEFPGYQPTRVVFDCPRIEHAIETETVELEPTGNGFGALVLDVDPRHTVALLGDTGARLNLHADGAEREFYLTFRRAERMDAGLRWSGVPAGRYRAAFAAGHTEPRFEVGTRGAAAGVITVGAGVTTQVAIAEGVGLAVLEPGLAGRPYAGQLAVRWRRVAEEERAPAPQWQSRQFPGPPYHLALMPPGRHEVEVMSPYHRPDDRPGATVDVEAGAEVAVDLALERRPPR